MAPSKPTYPMSSSIYYQKPLEWNTFLKLIQDIDEFLAKKPRDQCVKLASYQVAIAFGCYIGPKHNELLNLTRKDLSGSVYTFRFENRPVKIIPEHLKRIVSQNYDIVHPSTVNEFVLDNNFKIGLPITSRRFNKVLASIFDEYGINTPDPNFQTLRKTYALKTFIDLASSDEALDMLSEELGYELPMMKVFLRQ